MTRSFKSLIGMVCCLSSLAYGFGEKTVFSIRSQAVNAAQELCGWQQQTNKPPQDRTYFTVAFAPSYSHTFREKRIAEFLFGCLPLTFSGSLSPQREPTDILADYFGLPSDFKSTVSFDPYIINFFMDIDALYWYGWFANRTLWQNSYADCAY